MESVGNTTIQILDGTSFTSTFGYYPNIFDGTPQDTEGFGTVNIICQADFSGTIKAMHSIDNSVWDITDIIDYPGNDISTGAALFAITPIKAKWYKTQYIHDHDEQCNIRIQTILQPFTTDLTETIAPSLTTNKTPTVPTTTTSCSVVLEQPVKIHHDPIPQVWESAEIGDVTTAVSTELVIYNLYCMNFAPDYRFIKFYDISGDISINDRPKITLPVVADVPQNLQFANGLAFNNGLKIKATRTIKHDDINIAEAGDVHVIVTYST